MNRQSDVVGTIQLRTILSSRSLTAGLLCVFLGAIDLTVIASILSIVVPDLGVNTADIDRYIWVVNGYLISYVVAIPLLGRLSDVFGRQPAFVTCIVIFTVGSVLCATADTLTTLVVGRTIQGFGGGGLLPVTMALAADVLPRRMLLAGIGLVSAVDTLGWVLGPTWGALIVELVPVAHDPWRWVFWLNVPFLFMALAVVLKAFPPDERTMKRRPRAGIDFVGALLLATAMTATNLALASGGEIGARVGSGLRAFGGTPNPLADAIPLLLGIAAMAIAGLVIWERRTAYPIIPIELLRRKFFVATVVANFLVGSALMVGMVNVPVIVALIRDSDTVSRDSALLLAPLTIFIALFATLSGQIANVIGTVHMALLGVGLTAAGYASLYALVNRDNIQQMVLGLALAGTGIGLLLSPLSAIALDASSSDNRGAAASTAIVFRLLGMTIGMSLLTAAGVHRLQQLTGRLDPVIQGAGESTAEYLIRQSRFIEDHVIPLSMQVIRETFLAAGILATMAIVPVLLMRHQIDRD